MTASELLEVVERYFQIFSSEKDNLDQLKRQLAANEELNNRKNFVGHIAGDGVVLNKERNKILLIHHKIYGVWMQPGGHWESGEPNPLDAARREVEEETGVRELRYVSVDPVQPVVPFHLNTVSVPANPAKNEPQHWHHNFRYVFITSTTQLTHQQEEVHAAAWFAFDAPECAHVSALIDKLEKQKII